MTRQMTTCAITCRYIFQGALLIMGLTWMACGMRSDLIPASADQGDGGTPGAGGSAVTGNGGHVGTGGTTSAGGDTISGKGGSSTGGMATTKPASGGSTTVAQGGSGGSRSGGSGGHASGGNGGNGGSGGHASGGSGGHASGGSGSGGRSGTGGTTVTNPDASPRADALEVAPTPIGTPTLDPNSGYTTIATGTVVMSGYVSSSASGSGSTIGLTYNATSFCASGSVGVSTTYKSWAVVSFNVNQSQSGVSGSTEPLPLTGSEIAVSYANPAGSTLEFQLWDGTNFWCYYLPPSTGTTTTNIPFSKLNTACWDGSGTPFTSGTAITSVQLVVPGSATSATPFDYCFLGLTIK